MKIFDWPDLTLIYLHMTLVDLYDLDDKIMKVNDVIKQLVLLFFKLAEMIIENDIIQYMIWLYDFLESK